MNFSSIHRWVLGALLLAACDGAPRPMGTSGAGASGLATADQALQVCADGPTVPGIDVSVYQNDIDWAQVRDSGVVFAFIRVSNGTGTLDTRFVENWTEAAEEGVLRGAYQYFRPGQDPVAQADLLLDMLETHGAGELPPVIDVEQTDSQSAATIADHVGQWMDRVEAVLGVRPIIYTGSYFWNDSVSSPAFADDPLWIAHWGVSCPNLPDDWSDWVFWQTSATGDIPGIVGDVDTDVFNGDLQALIDFGGGPSCPDAPGCDEPEPTDAGQDPASEPDPEPEPEPAPDAGEVADEAGSGPDVVNVPDVGPPDTDSDDAVPEEDTFDAPGEAPQGQGRFGLVPDGGLDPGGCATAGRPGSALAVLGPIVWLAIRARRSRIRAGG